MSEDDITHEEFVVGSDYCYRLTLSQSGMLINCEYNDDQGRGYAFFIGRKEWSGIQDAVSKLFEASALEGERNVVFHDLMRDSKPEQC